MAREVIDALRTTREMVMGIGTPRKGFNVMAYNKQKADRRRMKQNVNEILDVCKCECGGNVKGIRDFGQLWTWCDKCTPVVEIRPEDWR